jgi:hypothetical protein
MKRIVYDQSGQNVALASKGATASGSFIGPDNDLPIDGTKRKHEDICLTLNGAEEWWEVRLPSPTLISNVTIFNRVDEGHRRRLEGARVLLLDENRNVVPTSFHGDRLLAGCRAPQTILLDESDTVHIVRISKSIDQQTVLRTIAEQFVLLHLGDMFPITQTCPLKEMGYDEKEIQVAYLVALLQEPHTDIASSSTTVRLILPKLSP